MCSIIVEGTIATFVSLVDSSVIVFVAIVVVIVFPTATFEVGRVVIDVAENFAANISANDAFSNVFVVIIVVEVIEA